MILDPYNHEILPACVVIAPVSAAAAFVVKDTVNGEIQSEIKNIFCYEFDIISMILYNLTNRVVFHRIL